MSVASTASIHSTLIQAPKMAPSPEAIAQAKDDFMAFVKSEQFELLAGNIVDFAIALRIIYKGAKGVPERAFGDATGLLFTEFFTQAEEQGHLKSASKIYFDEGLNQVSFVDDLAKRMIAYADEVEAADGVVLESSEEEIKAAKVELLEFIESDDFEVLAGCTLDAFKKKLAEIATRSQGDWMTGYLVDFPNSPGYSNLFINLIRDAGKDGFISEKIGRVFFAPEFDQISFVKHFVEALLHNCQTT